MKRSFRFRFLILGYLLLLISSAVSAQADETKADELFDAMQIREGSWIADVGSREGTYTIPLAKIAGTSGHVFAVDIDADALEDLHENIRKYDIGNITPVFSMTHTPMLPSGSLDAILIRNAYHEFTEPMSMLRHLKNALKPGGRLVMAEPVSKELENRSRERQARSHDIAIRFARQDVKDAGFKILEEVELFHKTRRGEVYWLIVAIRPER